MPRVLLLWGMPGCCAWYLLIPQLGMRGRLWESNGGCLALHARTSRISAQNQPNDVYLDRVLLVAQAAYYLNEERWRDKNKTFSLIFVRNFSSICFYFCPLLIFFPSNWNSSMSWLYLSLPTSFSVTLVQLTTSQMSSCSWEKKFHFAGLGEPICRCCCPCCPMELSGWCVLWWLHHFLFLADPRRSGY